MRILILSLFLCICCILIQCANTDLLDNPPKDKAEIFAPGIVSMTDKEHSKLSVAPDGKSMYWLLVVLPNEGEERKIGFVTMKNGKWGARELTQFGSEYGADSPCFLENDKLIFHARRKTNDDPIEFVDDFWMVKRKNDGWNEPQPLGFTKFPAIKKWAELAPLKNMPMPSVASNGNIYFMDDFSGGQYNKGIYVSLYQNDQYSVPVLLPKQINTEYFDWTPFIAPDESYLMFASNRPGSMGSTDIYITFRDQDEEWSDPINMGDKVNSKETERFPSVSPDGRIMFFLRDYDLLNQDYYWIEARFIEKLKPEELN